MNLYSAIAAHSDSQPDKPAIVHRDEITTYRQLHVAAGKISARLKALGIVEGDIVGIRMRETPLHAATLLGAMRVGAVVLPLDWRGAGGEAERVIARFPVKASLTDARKAHRHEVVVDVEGLAQTEPDSAPPAQLADHPLAYGLSSGTTGQPKAIIVTHEQMHARALALQEARLVLGDDRLLSALPLAFGFGRTIVTAALCAGATLTMFQTLFEPTELVAAVNGKDISVVAASPATTRALCASDTDQRPLMPDIRLYITGSAKLRPEDRAAARARICPNVVDYYGTIGTGLVSLITSEQDEDGQTSVGRLGTGVTVEIVDDDHRSLPTGKVGRIRIAGPSVSSAFAGEAPSTDEHFRDGRYYPGDLGRIDGRGLLHLHGRAADMIKRGGLTIHAQEVEQVLRQHDGVEDAAVVGVASERFGEEVKAFVVARDRSLTSNALVLHCRQHLAPHKVPAEVVLVAELPRNSSGKVVKSALKDIAEERHSADAGDRA